MMDFQKSSPYPMYYPRHPPRSTGVAPVAPPDPQIAPPPLPTTSYATVTTAITTPPTPTAPTAPTAAQETYILQTTAFPPRDEIPRSTMVYRYPPPPSPAVTIASTPYPPEKAYASARTEHHQRYHVTPTSRSSTKQPPERAYPAHPSSEGWREGEYLISFPCSSFSLVPFSPLVSIVITLPTRKIHIIERYPNFVPGLADQSGEADRLPAQPPSGTLAPKGSSRWIPKHLAPLGLAAPGRTRPRVTGPPIILICICICISISIISCSPSPVFLASLFLLFRRVFLLSVPLLLLLPSRHSP